MLIKKQAGFTIPVVLILVVVLSIGMSVSVKVTSTLVVRAKEAELIFRGLQIKTAIKRYYHAGTPSRYPRHLDDLILDPRFPYMSHLRKNYSDPFNVHSKANRAGGLESWGLIHDLEGGIIGVYSLNEADTVKKNGFPKGVEVGDGRGYQAWQFVYRPEKVAAQGLGISIDYR